MRILRPAVALVAWLVATAGVCTAMRSSCAVCFDNCCQWAYAADLASEYRPWDRTRPNPHSREAWEERGYPPPPCQDVLADKNDYHRCAWNTFLRCRKTRCPRCRRSSLLRDLNPLSRKPVGKTEPLEFYPGQVIVIEKKRQQGGTP